MKGHVRLVVTEGEGLMSEETHVYETATLDNALGLARAVLAAYKQEGWRAVKEKVLPVHGQQEGRGEA